MNLYFNGEVSIMYRVVATKFYDDEDYYYYGKEEFEKWGEQVFDTLEGEKISKRIDHLDKEDGLDAMSARVGLSRMDLLRTLEGMCYNGMAREIDDSTYLVKKY